MLHHFDTNKQDVYIAYSISIHKSEVTEENNNMSVHVAALIEPQLWFAKRCIQFIKMALISDNNKLCTISNMDRYSLYSIMDASVKGFNDKYCMDERNVYATWRGMSENNEDVFIVCMQVKELVDMRNRCIDGY